jgi:ATP-dependent Clp protease ATP-binding subunit ClpA
MMAAGEGALVEVFERYTDRARRVVVLAQEEARMLNHNYIGTEHILLGLIHEGEGVAAKALESLGISLQAVRQQVQDIIGRGQQAPSPRMKSITAYRSWRRAKSMLAASWSMPTTCGTRDASSLASVPSPQPTSSTRWHPCGTAAKISRW